jgi:GlpG protein
MRLLYTFKNDRDARTFSQFLTQEGVENTLEINPVTDWGSEDYGTLTCRIWIIDEDSMDEARSWLEAFLKNPGDSRFKASKQPRSTTPKESLPKPSLYRRTASRSRSNSPLTKSKNFGAFTFYLILFCTIIFFTDQATKRPFEPPPSNLPMTPLFASPIKKSMLFDYPTTYTMVDKLINAYGFDKLFHPQDLPNEGKFLLGQIYRTPYWQGFYDQFVSYFGSNGSPIQVNAPMFEKIKQGEIWRLFSPIFLHGDIFHLFFNMLWLLVLGVQMEKRLGIRRLILFILITAAISNTCQYLMSGPNFVGFSGVLCAMIAFIWLRQKNTPWEGYQLHPSTMAFISIFIAAMFLIQLISFTLEILGQPSLNLVIANTAHLSGAFTGFLLSQLPFFSWKIKT